MGTSLGRSDFWDCLGAQALAMIGWWYSRQPYDPRNRRAESLYPSPMWILECGELGRIQKALTL